jgi:gamma-glutamyltranspeptidase/glutathione hydrolase
MTFSLAPFGPRTGRRGMVNAADQLAAGAGIGALEQGGSAADAAVAAAAVMAVTSPHLCGMGGDLLAMVSTRPGCAPRVTR